MLWIMENHFLFVSLFDRGNAETKTFSVSQNRGGFTLAESRTRKSGTITPPIAFRVFCLNMFFTYLWVSYNIVNL